MKFEKMNKQEQLKSLVRLHDILNDGLFNGELERAFSCPPIDEIGEDGWRPPHGKTLCISIGRAGHGIGLNALACFHFPDEDIIFDADYIRYILSDYCEDEQCIMIATVGAQAGNKNAEKQMSQNATVDFKARTPHTDEIIQQCYMK